jgi:hypothetical protein
MRSITNAVMLKEITRFELIKNKSSEKIKTGIKLSKILSPLVLLVHSIISIIPSGCSHSIIKVRPMEKRNINMKDTVKFRFKRGLSLFLLFIVIFLFISIP